MAASVGFLYGDATPSPLKSDFIAFLRDAVDYAVEVLGADARTAAEARDVERLAEQTEREIAAAEELATDVARALEGPSLRAPASLAGRCAARLQREAHDLVRSEAEAARACGRRGSEPTWRRAASKEVAACTKAFEALVLAHTLPDSLGVTVVNAGGRRAVRGDPRMPDAVRPRMDDGARHPRQSCARARAPDRSARRAARGRGAGGGRVASTRKSAIGRSGSIACTSPG